MHTGKPSTNIGKRIHLLVGMAMVILVGCASLPKNFDRPVSLAYTDTEDTRLGEARRLEMAAHPGQSGFLLLKSGLDAFVARAVLTHTAERSIDLQYYLYHDETTSDGSGGSRQGKALSSAPFAGKYGRLFFQPSRLRNRPRP